MRSPSPALKYVIAILGTLLAGWLSGLVTRGSLDWYDDLAKPSFAPPNAVFGPMWTALYIVMGIAAARVWCRPPDPLRREALQAYVVQLVFNVAWSLLFFGARSMGMALVDILCLLAAIVWCMRAFAPVDRTAAWLLLPYLLWVLFATALNAALRWMN